MICLEVGLLYVYMCCIWPSARPPQDGSLAVTRLPLCEKRPPKKIRRKSTTRDRVRVEGKSDVEMSARASATNYSRGC